MPDSQFLRKPMEVSSMPGSGHLLLFSDQQPDNLKIADKNITASSFIRLGMKEAVIKDSSFTRKDAGSDLIIDFMKRPENDQRLTNQRTTVSRR
jgi:hypothetical protein